MWLKCGYEKCDTTSWTKSDTIMGPNICMHAMYLAVSYTILSIFYIRLTFLYHDLFTGHNQVHLHPKVRSVTFTPVLLSIFAFNISWCVSIRCLCFILNSFLYLTSISFSIKHGVIENVIGSTVCDLISE